MSFSFTDFKNYKTQLFYVIVALSVVGVIGLLVRLIDGNLGTGAAIAADDDFGRLNDARIMLLVWETFWLTSIAIFFFVIARRAKGKKSDEGLHKLEQFEPTLFRLAVGFLVLAAIGSLLVPALIGAGLPHYLDPSDAEDVPVIANQFAFNIDGNACPVTIDAAQSCVTLNVDTKYNFQLTTTDTTHGFALYDTDNVLILQAQIVPGYNTNLVHTFDEAGTYYIRCSEYCGAGHHIMVATITVV